MKRGLDQPATDATPVAAGGDGTVNMLVRALHELGMADRPFATLPLGTGNAFAHAIGIGRLKNAMNALLDGEVRSVDVMLTTHPQVPVAVASLSAGFEAAAMSDVARGAVTGILTGTRSALRHIGAMTRDVSLEVDGERLLSPRDRIFNAGLYTIPCYAFGWRVLPTADSADGSGEAVISMTRSAYLRFLAQPAVPWQLTRSTGLLVRRWRHAFVSSSSPFQVDGDARPAGDMDVRIEQGALRVLSPRTDRFQERVTPTM